VNKKNRRFSKNFKIIIEKSKHLLRIPCSLHLTTTSELGISFFSEQLAKLNTKQSTFNHVRFQATVVIFTVRPVLPTEFFEFPRTIFPEFRNAAKSFWRLRKYCRHIHQFVLSGKWPRFPLSRRM